MAITSVYFLLFALAQLATYFLAPKRWRWVTLLVGSCVFYCSYGPKYFLWVLFTSLTVYAATRAMQAVSDRQAEELRQGRETLSREEKSRLRSRATAKKRRVMLAALLANLAVLCVFKYSHFALSQWDGLAARFWGAEAPARVRLIAPLGISFYTFQMIGYLMEVYWGNLQAERSYPKVLLFCSFFPQMTQGPISEYSQLASQLYEGHDFTYRNWSWGMQRMAWGFFKKMVVADALAPCVSTLFANYMRCAGISVFLGAVLYSVQIYADFSGYMDIMCGLCEVMGIRLTENFERPYFSKSVAEYWRRWHISLGAWFKRYVYYPIGISRWSRALGKAARSRLGRRFGDAIPATVALIVVWLATGLWHGASWAYIAWGLLNGLFIILTLWLEPVYAACRKALRIRESSWLWKAFRTARTFLLVTFIKVLPEVGSLSDGFGLWKRIFTNHTVPRSLRQLLPFVSWSLTATVLQFGVACMGTACMLAVSLLQRREPIRARTERWPMPVRVLLFVAVFFLILTFGVQNSWEGGGFLYAQF